MTSGQVQARYKGGVGFISIKQYQRFRENLRSRSDIITSCRWELIMYVCEHQQSKASLREEDSLSSP